jgi:hypothetical protein
MSQYCITGGKLTILELLTSLLYTVLLATKQPIMDVSVFCFFPPFAEVNSATYEEGDVEFWDLQLHPSGMLPTPHLWK